MEFLLIAVCVVFVVLMLVGLWLSSRSMADTVLAPFQRLQDEEERRQARELRALLDGDQSATKKAQRKR